MTADTAVVLGSRYRVYIVRFLVDAALIALVIALLPGIDVRFESAWLGFSLMAVVYGLLAQFLRPPLNLVLLPFLIQSYGLVLLVVDVVIFAVLMVIFSNPVEIGDVVSVVIGGALIGVFRLAAEGVLGLSPPVMPGLDLHSPGNTRGALPSGLPAAAERVRLLRIRRALFRHGLDALFSRGITGEVRRWMQTKIWQPSAPIEVLPLAVRFRLLLQDLGPTYVKIGQIISSRARALPDDWHRELELLQSDAPEYPYEDVRARIVDELGAPPEELYASFDRVPLAAASLAQVHRAVLLNGDQVAVKVQRPDIQTKLESDIKLLVRVAEALATKAGWATEIDLPGIVGEFGSTLLRELDYTIEAYNARRLNRVLSSVEGIRVPEVHHELSSAGVLTLEFIPGVKSTDYEAIVEAGLDPEVLADRTIRGAVKMLVFEGFFHADPHPGNVFVNLENGEVVMLDTGMVGELTLTQRLKIAGLAQAVTTGDLPGMAQSLKALSTQFKEGDDAHYYREFQRRLTPFLDPPPGQRVDVTGRVLPAGMAVLREAGYRIDPEFTLALKSMTQAEAITTALVSEWAGSEFMDRALAAGREMAEEVVTQEAVADAAVRQATFIGRELLQEMPSLQSGARGWIDSLKKGGVTVQLDTSALDKQVSSLRAMAQAATLGVITAGLIVGSAIAAGIGGLEGSVLQPVTGLAAVVFTMTSVIGIGLVLIGGFRFARRSRPPNDGRL